MFLSFKQAKVYGTIIKQGDENLTRKNVAFKYSSPYFI